MPARAMARFFSGACFTVVCLGVAFSAATRAFAEPLLFDPAGIRGTVVDPDGRPVAGAMLIRDARQRNLFKDYGGNRIPKTDAEGKFEVPGEAPAVLTVFAPDWQLQSVRVQPPLKEPLKIVMRKGKRVEFRAVDLQGRPIPGISFFPERPRREFFDLMQDQPYYDVLSFLSHRYLIHNRSDANGLSVWENAPDEALAYQIIGPHVLSQPGGEYGPEGSPYTLVFRPTIPVNATVVDAATGEPIAKYEVVQGMHFKSNPPGIWDWSSHTPGKDEAQADRFFVRLLTLDRIIRYRVEAEGYRPALSASLDAASLPDAPVTLEFRLQKQAEYEGTLLAPDGTPAGGAEVYFKAGDRDRNRMLTELSGIRVVNGTVDPKSVTTSMNVAPDGKLRLDPAQDPFICFISHASGYAALMDADLLACPEHTLIPWAAIRGRLFLKGEPAANVPVSGVQTDLVRQNWTAITNAAGEFEFTRCFAGRFDERIEYARFPRYLQSLELDLAPGRTVVQRLGAEGADL